MRNGECGTFSNLPSLPRRPLPDNVRAFGAALRKLRDEHDMSMGELARLLDCNVTRLSDVERGDERDPAFAFCVKCGGHRCAVCEQTGIVATPLASEEKG